jgi:hypothetical protein
MHGPIDAIFAVQGMLAGESLRRSDRDACQAEIEWLPKYEILAPDGHVQGVMY